MAKMDWARNTRARQTAVSGSEEAFPGRGGASSEVGGRKAGSGETSPQMVAKYGVSNALIRASIAAAKAGQVVMLAVQFPPPHWAQKALEEAGVEVVVAG